MARVTCRSGNLRLGPWVRSMAKNAMSRGSATMVGEAFGVPNPQWTSRALKKKMRCPLLKGTALSNCNYEDSEVSLKCGKLRQIKAKPQNPTY